MKAGTYHFCTCGHSATQPFCDGAHKASGTGLSPAAVTLETDQKVAWCGCKRSAKGSRCDGTHKRLPG
jgi:CDGSH iron-sulfur domain-containing protein 3